jgi:phage terminase large subunit-like protein
VNNLAVLATSSWFRPLSADASKMDGLNVHFAAVDEVHEHATPEIIQKLNTATGARRQPLIFEITTAGHDRHSVCRQHHEFSVKALEGTIPDEAADSWFAFIATIDDGDDWTDPAVWSKANPSLGVTVKAEDLKRQIDEAREMPAQQNAIRRLRLNEWTEQVTRWIDMDVWAEGAAPIDEEELVGRHCYAGLDLARVNDLSSLALIFPPQDAGEAVKIIWRHWCPEDDILRRPRALHDLARPRSADGYRRQHDGFQIRRSRRSWRLPRASLSRSWLTTGPSPARSCATSRTKGCRWSSSARAFSAWGRPLRNSCAF